MYCKQCFISKHEAAVGERVAYWIHTPQVPGSNSTLSTKLLNDYHNNSIINSSIHWYVWNVGEEFPSQV